VVNEKLTGKSAVDDYFSSLLLDTQVGQPEVESDEPVLRFARVEPGYEVAAIWSGTLTAPQQRCVDLFLLSCLRSLPGTKLRMALLNAIHIGKVS
jgi:hypothetical protein